MLTSAQKEVYLLNCFLFLKIDVYLKRLPDIPSVSVWLLYSTLSNALNILRKDFASINTSGFAS